MPIEYWRATNLFAIARGTGTPPKIDEKTLTIENGIFARILVDVDLVGSLPERILVKRRLMNFLVDITYEKLSLFCSKCWAIGHDYEQCHRGNGAYMQGQAERAQSECRVNVQKGVKEPRENNQQVQGAGVNNNKGEQNDLHQNGESGTQQNIGNETGERNNQKRSVDAKISLGLTTKNAFEVLAEEDQTSVLNPSDELLPMRTSTEMQEGYSAGREGNITSLSSDSGQPALKSFIPIVQRPPGILGSRPNPIAVTGTAPQGPSTFFLVQQGNKSSQGVGQKH